MGKVMNEVVFLNNFRARFSNDSAFVAAVKDMYQANMISSKAWEIVRDEYSTDGVVTRTTDKPTKSTPSQPDHCGVAIKPRRDPCS